MMDSAKIVGGLGKRREMDFYPTPAECTQALVDFLYERKLLMPGDTVWEPACGDMAMVDVLEDNGLRVIATDITTGKDFLTANDGRARWVITNPPFCLAERFIWHAAELGVPFAFLLKSQYWHSKKRLGLFQMHAPSYVLPLTWRPDFTGQGSSLMDMAWNVWCGNPGFTQYIALEKPAFEKDGKVV